jgi:hypothetical protein
VYVLTVFVVVEDHLEIPIAQVAKCLPSARRYFRRRSGWTSWATSATIIQHDMRLEYMMDKYLDAAKRNSHSLGAFGNGM